MKKESLIKKIQALLDKTIENGATQSEMEAALSKATQLIESHNISEYELNQKFEDEKCILQSTEREISSYDLTLFLNALANLFGTQYHYNYYKVSFFGYKSDVELCIYFYKAIVESLRLGVANYKKSEGYISDKNYFHGRTLIKSWLHGFQDGISTKMILLYIERQREREKANYGLVLLNKEEKIELEYKSKYNPRVTKERQSTVVESTYKAGYSLGREAELTQGLTGNQKIKLIED